MDRRPLLLLILPARLEDFALREEAEGLLASPSVAALEPPPVSYARLARAPGPLAARFANAQARRLKLPGEPRAALIYDPLQYPLARAVIARHEGCELWYRPPDDPGRSGRAEELHALAVERAALVLDGPPGPDALRAAGIAG